MRSGQFRSHSCPPNPISEKTQKSPQPSTSAAENQNIEAPRPKPNEVHCPCLEVLQKLLSYKMNKHLGKIQKKERKCRKKFKKHKHKMFKKCCHGHHGWRPHC